MYQIEIRRDGVLQTVIHIEPREPKPGFALNQRQYDFIAYDIGSEEYIKGDFVSDKDLSIRKLVETIAGALENIKNGDK